MFLAFLWPGTRLLYSRIVKKKYFLVSLVLLTFFVVSFLTNIIGPLIPEIIESFHLSLTLVSFLPFSFFIAYGLMSIPAGILTEKYGGKIVMVLAFFVSFIGAILFAIIPSYSTSIVSLFLIGTGMAMLQVVINPLLRTAGGNENFYFYSILGQLFFGLASFLSPLVYSFLVTNVGSDTVNFGWINFLSSIVPPKLPWVSLYWIFALVAFAMILVISSFKFPKVELKEDERIGTIQTHIQLFKNKYVILFFFGIFCYVGSEQGIANWMSKFLSSYHGIDPQTKGASVISYFWGMMTIGTLLGLFLVKIFNSKGILTFFSLGAIVCLTAALFGSETVALYAFPMLGFFAAVMYPIIISLALNSVLEHHGSFSGILITGVSGGAIVSLIIGFIGDHVSLLAGLIFLYLTFGYILSIGIWARPLVTNMKMN